MEELDCLKQELENISDSFIENRKKNPHGNSFSKIHKFYNLADLSAYKQYEFENSDMLAKSG